MLPSDTGDIVSVPGRETGLTVIDFFTPTCEPCRDKVPALWSMRSRLAARDAALVLVGILSEDESTEDARAALEEWGAGGARFLVDRGEASSREAGVTEVPAVVLVGRDGVLRWRGTPHTTPRQILAAVREHSE